MLFFINPSIEELPNGRLRLCADLPAGLHVLTVDADASAFDWSELYIVFNCYGNVDQRTGPWDFDELNENRPLVPAYRVYLDGRRLGLWYFNRLSTLQVEQKRFKGEMGFFLPEARRCELEFEPYRSFCVHWDKVELGPEPYDRLEAIDPLPVANRLLPEVMPENRFTSAFLKGLDFFKQKTNSERNSGFQLPSLAAAWKWRKDAEALAAVRQIIKVYLELPAWGNPHEDGYGHNGDMGAATPLFGIAAALRWIGPELNDLREAALKRLEHQGNLLFEMALLHRGYWGGCLLQDHGIVTMSWFACAGYLLSDILPASRRWLSFAVPRVLRSFDAMPQDGIIPETSYRRMWMYADKFPLFREMHLFAGGEDIYDRPAIRNIPSAARICQVEDTGEIAFPFCYSDYSTIDGAQAFLAQMADLGDADAQFLLERFMMPESLGRSRNDYAEWHVQKDWLWALLFHRPGQAPKPLSIKGRRMDHHGTISAHWFQDTGAGVLRSGKSLLIAHCGPPVAHSSYPKLTCCNDRIVATPLSGNFIFSHEGRPIIRTAEGTYRQESAIGNVLLVDGKGQKGDIGIPMCYPDFPYEGQSILGVQAASGITMDLAPVYEDLTEYQRTLRLDEAGALHCVDTVSTEAGRLLTWRFQTAEHHRWTPIVPTVWDLEVDGALYRVRFNVDGTTATATIGKTITVWGYVSDAAGIHCHHLAIEARSEGRAIGLTLLIEPMTETQ
jgi:hypothetical protein